MDQVCSSNTDGIKQLIFNMNCEIDGYLKLWPGFHFEAVLQEC